MTVKLLEAELREICKEQAEGEESARALQQVWHDDTPFRRTEEVPA